MEAVKEHYNHAAPAWLFAYIDCVVKNNFLLYARYVKINNYVDTGLLELWKEALVCELEFTCSFACVIQPFFQPSLMYDICF